MALSTIHFQNIFRVYVFAKVMNLLDSYDNYSVDEMKKYLEGV